MNGEKAGDYFFPGGSCMRTATRENAKGDWMGDKREGEGEVLADLLLRQNGTWSEN